MLGIHTKPKKNNTMRTESTSTAGYLLLFRGSNWRNSLSPEQIQTLMSEWAAWFNRLAEEGKLKGGQPLEREARVVSGANRVVSDGPFAESKEEIGGYFYLTVEDLDAAVEVAKQCPGLGYGISVEVRPVADQCPYTRAVANASTPELVEAGA